MLTLERLRLVNWHNFDDTVIEIGNRCMFAGDNGTGKTTVIDAIQYVMTANLRMAKFNSAAEERRSGGRDLIGYVRCKLGSESTEYRRGDTIAHVMLEWRQDNGTRTGERVSGSTSNMACPPENVNAEKNLSGGRSGPEPGKGFVCGVCVEAYKDNSYSERFWIGTKESGSSDYDISIETLNVCNDKKEPLLFRQFRSLLEEKKIEFCPTKKEYIKNLTNRLGVFKRQPEVNPYLDSLTRSIGFKPLNSIDQFVCDYILEDNPVDISSMKYNLESYKEAERQAKAAARKIDALKKISEKAAEWRNYDGFIVKQEFLKLRIEMENEKQKKDHASRQLAETRNDLEKTNHEISALNQKQTNTEQERRAIEEKLITNDAHRLYEEIRTRIKRLEHDLEVEGGKAERYRTLKSQCEIMLNREIKENEGLLSLDAESIALDEEVKKYRDEKYKARQKKEEAEGKLKDTRLELADLERGIFRYPDAPRELKAALEKAGIEAHFLAELAEITDPAWVDAVEGWLNTRRFALLVNPDHFQKALEVYDHLPRSIAGAFIPNIKKMRDADVKSGSLAKFVNAGGYARIYIDFILGRVMAADISSLKTYDSAVSKECMSYANHTASRIREDVYKRHYLGSTAREEHKKFLITEVKRLETDLANTEREEREATGQEECCNRVIHSLTEMKLLFPSVADCVSLNNDLNSAHQELAAIDTQSFEELEGKRKELEEQLDLFKKENNLLQNKSGSLETELINIQEKLDIAAHTQEEKEEAIKKFGIEYPIRVDECESYAEKRFSEVSIEELSSTYESTLKGFRTHADTNKKEYGRLVGDYERDFHDYLEQDPAENTGAEILLKRLETSELPEYLEKIVKARHDAETEFKEHFISRLNEHIVQAKDSFREINGILRDLPFGHEQYAFHLEELAERKGQIKIIRQAAGIPTADEGLFSQLTDPAERKATEDLFDRILNSPLDSKELKDICDYRTYFHYDILITQTDIKEKNGEPLRQYLSKVLKEKSGGESQTPYYVAIAASFYRFYKTRPETTVRLVIFDEAFNRMDDERISKILSFYNSLNLQIITSVPPEKIEAITPYMDRTNVIIRKGSAVRIRDCHPINGIDMSDIEIGSSETEKQN